METHRPIVHLQKKEKRKRGYNYNSDSNTQCHFILKCQKKKKKNLQDIHIYYLYGREKQRKLLRFASQMNNNRNLIKELIEWKLQAVLQLVIHFAAN